MVKYYALLGVTIVLETLGTTLLKLSDGFNKPIYGVLSLVAFGLLFYLFSFVIRHIPIGVAYAIWSALGIVLISLVGWIFMGQKLDLPAILGILLIIGGVVTIQLFSKSISH
ncbi:SMR family transporter [Campylobacter gastrosuis]|uniref:SMR family transporter n=1 Tax=Campylobacter gastrosuis TaxID=2974576 RepID=A0ABT7HMR1_9BACT|nr:SMR family transporter [Campylobacter gastrosuis]MDL0088207.1 SMR family transporter [Campylobacter gastrosuis]